MRQLVLAVGALSVLGLATVANTPARADDKVIIKDHREHRDHLRFFDRFRHRDHDRNVLVIKRGHDHDHDHDHDHF